MLALFFHLQVLSMLRETQREPFSADVQDWMMPTKSVYCIAGQVVSDATIPLPFTTFDFENFPKANFM